MKKGTAANFTIQPNCGGTATGTATNQNNVS